MPTIIDSLLVTLNLDSSKFDKGQKKAVESIEDISEATEKASKKRKKQRSDDRIENKRDSAEFSSMASTTAKFLGVIGSALALKSFITNTITSNAAVGRFAQNLGVSAKSMKVWQAAAELMGGSAADATSAFSLLNKAQFDLKTTGQSPLIAQLSQFGVALVEDGKAKELTDVFRDLAASAQKMDRNFAFNLLTQMGITPDFANVILQGSTALEEMIKQQERLAAVNDKTAESFIRAEKAATNAVQVLKRVGESGVAGAANIVLDFPKDLKKEIDFVKETIENALSGISEIFGPKEAETPTAPATKEEARKLLKSKGLSDAQVEGFVLQIQGGTSNGVNLQNMKGLFERNDAAKGKKEGSANKLFNGVPGATSSLGSATSSVGLAMASRTSNSTSSSSRETNIGEVKIYTQATDAAGIAGAIKPALNYLFVPQADYALT